MHCLTRLFVFTVVSATALTFARPTFAMLPGDGSLQECDTYLNVHTDGYGNIIGVWISYENCVPVTSGGGGGTPAGATEVNMIRPNTDCTNPSERGGISQRCCECYRQAARDWKKCKSDARWVPAAERPAALRICQDAAERDATSCVAFGSCA